MNAEVRDWAWGLGVSPTRKLVALALAEHAGVDRECWPSISRLEQLTGLARSTVVESLSDLEKRHLISRDRGGPGRSTRYRLCLNGSPTAGLAGSPPAGPNGAPVVRQPDQGSPAVGLDSPIAGLCNSSTAGLCGAQVVRQSVQGSSKAGPSSPTDGPEVVRQPDPNRESNSNTSIRRRSAHPREVGDSGGAMRARAEEEAKETAAPIPNDWQPSSRVTNWVEKQGMSAVWAAAQVDEFIVYWSDRGEARRSWDATFMNRLRTLHERKLANNRGTDGTTCDRIDKDYGAGATPLSEIPWMRNHAIG